MSFFWDERDVLFGCFVGHICPFWVVLVEPNGFIYQGYPSICPERTPMLPRALEETNPFEMKIVPPGLMVNCSEVSDSFSGIC